MPSDREPSCPHDFTIRRLERELDAERAINDATWEDGYREGCFDRDSDIPEELTTALRYGSAQQHVAIPVGDDQVIVVLARDGTCCPRGRSEARTWKTIRNVHRALVAEAQRQPGVDQIRRHDLPEAVAAVVWRSAGQVAVVVSRSADRRSVLRSRAARAGSGGALTAVVSWAVWKQVLPFLAMGTAVATAAFTLLPGTDTDSASTRPVVHAPRAMGPWPTPASSPNGTGSSAMSSPRPSPSASGTVPPDPLPSGAITLGPSASPPAIQTPDPLVAPDQPIVRVRKPGAPVHRKPHPSKPPKVAKPVRAPKLPKAARPGRGRGRRPAGLLGAVTSLLGL